MRARTSEGFQVDSDPLTVIIGSPHSLFITRQPGQTAVGGTAFAPEAQPRVVVHDLGRNIVMSFSGTVTATLTQNEQGAALVGDSIVTVKDGVAIFRALAIPRAGSCYSMIFTGMLSLIPVTSSSVSVAIGPSFQLGILSQPAGFRPGFPFDIQPVIAVQDRGGELTLCVCVCVCMYVCTAVHDRGGEMTACVCVRAHVHVCV